MDAKQTPSGRHQDIKRTPNGHFMDTKWTFHRHQMDVSWTPNGLVQKQSRQNTQNEQKRMQIKVLQKEFCYSAAVSPVFCSPFLSVVVSSFSCSFVCYTTRCTVNQESSRLTLDVFSSLSASELSCPMTDVPLQRAFFTFSLIKDFTPPGNIHFFPKISCFHKLKFFF